MGQRLTSVESARRAGPTSARTMPRIAFTSRDDQPVLVKIVRSVFLVACGPRRRVEIALRLELLVQLADQPFELAMRRGRLELLGGRLRQLGSASTIRRRAGSPPGRG